jgi:hypothetical protein
MDQTNLPHIFGVTDQLAERRTMKHQSSKTIERICRESHSRLTHAQEVQNPAHKVQDEWV